MVIEIFHALVAKLAVHGVFVDVDAADPAKLGAVVSVAVPPNFAVVIPHGLPVLLGQMSTQPRVDRIDFAAHVRKTCSQPPADEDAYGARDGCREWKDGRGEKHKLEQERRQQQPRACRVREMWTFVRRLQFASKNLGHQ